MHHTIIRLLVTLLCWLPISVAAASQSIHVEWGYTPPSSPTVTGYKLYQEGALACQTQDPNATAMDCQVSLTQDTTNFTLTATFSDNTESPHSAPFPFTSTATGTTNLNAIIVASTSNGPAPLSVGFDASTSTGSIVAYRWDFGDGSAATTQTASHLFANAGTYTTKLTITDSAGQTSTASITVTVASVAAPAPTPPTAVISSSAATGPAPLTVSFDGSGSTATNATLTAYNWSFGDGSSATGSTATHAYTTAGTYTATLTITDSNGQIDEVGTPVIVTTSTITNKVPQAVISATPTSGSAPLTVSFDGGGSTDSDGTVTSYVWNFGDGSSATGKTASHTYTTEATFTATLQVTDNQGAKGNASVTITAKAEVPTTEVKMETGDVMVSSNWVRVPLTTSFANPIVIAGPPSFNNSEPCVVHLRNVNATGFDIKLAEWNYQDGAHPQETISYLVMEKGRHTLTDGSVVEAGSFAGTTSFKTVPFSAAFAKIPVVLTTIASVNETDTISGRIKDVTTSGFAYYFREQEKNQNKHVNETVNFIAWEPGKGTIGSVQFEVVKTGNAVTNAWYSTTYQTPFSQAPLLLAHMQTTAAIDTSALRVQQPTAAGFQIKVEEEQSKDSEVTHPAESVGYIALNQSEEKTFVSFTWDFDATQEATIKGFAILANGEPICTTDAPSARTLSCETTRPSGPTAFTIQAVENTGSTSSPSNSITYKP